MKYSIRPFLAFSYAGYSYAIIQGLPPPFYTANPTVGGGAGAFKDSAHFRIYGSAGEGATDLGLKELESAYVRLIFRTLLAAIAIQLKSADLLCGRSEVEISWVVQE
jgi:hypothetical protein